MVCSVRNWTNRSSLPVAIESGQFLSAALSSSQPLPEFGGGSPPAPVQYRCECARRMWRRIIRPILQSLPPLFECSRLIVVDDQTCGSQCLLAGGEEIRTGGLIRLKV